MKCGDCKHISPYGDSETRGVCYRYPPTAEKRGGGAAGRPMVWLSERSCGEFEEKEES